MPVLRPRAILVASLLAFSPAAFGQAQSSAQTASQPSSQLSSQPASHPAVQPAPATQPGRVEVFPPSIRLDGPRDFQSLVIREVDPTGVTCDRLKDAALTVENAAVAVIREGMLFPRADGETVLAIALDGQSIHIPVAVTALATPQPIHFRTDVLPALSKAGCNSGACHGSARGQDGFHLSLFGYDPDADYLTVTRELPGRRINLARPETSLLLTKATGQAPHTGGQRFTQSDERYATILGWLRAGAPADPADLPRVVGIELFPQDIVLRGAGATQSLMVRAKYSDGSDRDVTRDAVFISNNEQSTRADDHGLLTAGERGEALVMARYDAFTVGTQTIVIPADAPDDVDAGPAANYIDEAINAKLRKLRVQPSSRCGDEEFLRRASLDITGLLPTVERYDQFMADAAPDKRAKLVDDLLGQKEFVEIWVMKWAERLGLRSTEQVSYKAMLLYYDWLQERIAANVPINRIVRELVASDGGTFSSPATNYYQLEQDTLKLSENTAQSFLGVRIQCAQCHNHPFDRWTMNDYYGFAAFFAQVGRKPGEDPRETIVFNSGGGEIKHPVGGRVMAPTFLGGATPDLAGRDRRAVLADWLTAPDNRMFARNVANFVWAQFFARGIVEPADDARVSNPPANAQLLDALADRLVGYDFDVRRLVRDICLSNAYQRSTVVNASNADDLRNFSHAQVRRIRAEALLDSISRVTNTRDKFRGLPRGARAVQIADGNTSTYFLTTFGRAKRESVCTCEVVMEPNLSQALHLINGETTHQKIREGKVVSELLKSGRTPDQVIERLYVACLSRRPTDAELQSIRGLLAGAADPAPILDDLFWALLNSKEFMFNH